MNVSSDWLALTQIHGVGPGQCLKLLASYPHISDLFKASEEELRALGFSAKVSQALQQPLDFKEIEAALTWAEHPEHHIIPYTHPAYPFLLKQITYPPIVLFVKGQLDVLNTPQMAIVGSRNPTPLGLEITQQFAASLVDHAYTITSGLALGIDAASHWGALHAKGQTIAVLGTGLDCIYPKAHQKLAAQIVAQDGALVSEYPPETRPRPEHFPRRNRIISGLSLGVLVVEATLRSGSLITARFAAEQGREVFAVPGSIFSAQAQGCHALIHQGAKLVQTVADILEELTQYPIKKQEQKSFMKLADRPALDPNLNNLLKQIGFAPTSMAQLVQRTALAIPQLASMLSLLELKGVITTLADGCYARVKTLGA